MKRLLLASLLGLSALLQVPGQVSASGAFGLFTCGGCCKKCGCEVCIRPYNAFSPVLCGSICVDNCVPFVGPQCACAPRMGGQMPMPGAPMMPVAPGPYGPMPYYAPGWGGAMPPMQQGPAPMPQLDPSAPQLPPAAAPTAPPIGTPGNPEPLKPPVDSPTIASQGMGTMPYGAVQPANYYPYQYQYQYPYQYPGYMPYYRPMVPMYGYGYPMMP